MKKIYVILAAATALTFASCNQNRLEIPQKGVVAEEDFYKTDEDCEQAIAAVYSQIRSGFLYNHFNVVELPGDDCYKGSSGYKLDDCHTLMLSIFDDTHSYVRNEFQNLYRFVYRCNLVIENFKDGTSQVQKQAVAEARTIRSWAYLYLIQLWGNPPIIDHVLRTSAEFKQPNATKEDLWKFVINSLDEAINSGAMVTKSDSHDKTAVRATKEFAMALKGKTQVLSGDYAGAKTTLKAIIDSKKYELIPSELLGDYFFSSAGNHNCESIFETNVVVTSDNYKKVSHGDSWYAYCAPRIDKLKIKSGSYLSKYVQGWQYFQPTQSFLEAMIAHEGMYSHRFKAWFWDYEAMINNGLVELSSVRTAKTQKLLDENPAGTPSKNLDSGTSVDHTGEICGIWHRKFVLGPEECINGSYSYDAVDRLYFRYAEVLLLYAEACAQLGETSGDGLKALNEIASRAGAPTYTTLNMENVKMEKRFEMWGEGVRFFDLIRWGDAATVLKEHWNVLPVFYGYQKGKSAKDLTADGKNVWDVYDIRQLDLAGMTGQTYFFRPEKDVLMPYPATEIANNPLLVQNPGW